MCCVCIHRWYGSATGEIERWRCRKDLKLSRENLPVIGSDEDLAKANGCNDFKRVMA